VQAIRKPVPSQQLGKIGIE